MECPKCHSKHIRKVAVFTPASTLERYTDVQAWVEGYSCIMCGYWADLPQSYPKNMMEEER